MLAHWLDYYFDVIGVWPNHTSVILHEDFAPSASVVAAVAVLSAVGVTGTLVPGAPANVLEGIKLKRLNVHLSMLPENAWLIFADVDEFFVYPCDVLARIGKRDAACGFMTDRIAVDARSLPPVRAAPALAEQYPRCVKIRGYGRAPIAGNPLKLVLLRARTGKLAQIPVFITAHRARISNRTGANNFVGGYPAGGTQNQCVFLGRFSHYSMTEEAMSLAARKRDDREYAPLYQAMLKLVEPARPNRSSGIRLTERGFRAANSSTMSCPLTCACTDVVDTPSGHMRAHTD